MNVKVVNQVIEHKAEWQKHFGKDSDSRAASELKRTNPAEYERQRQEWLRAERIPPTPLEQAKARIDAQGRERQYSELELRARQAFTPEQVRAIYNKSANEPGESVDSIRKSDKARYELLRAAALSYEIVRPSLVEVRDNSKKTKPEPAPVDTTTYLTISDSLAAKFNLKPGTKVPSEQLSVLIELAAKNEEQSK